MRLSHTTLTFSALIFCLGCHPDSTHAGTDENLQQLQEKCIGSSCRASKEEMSPGDIAEQRGNIILDELRQSPDDEFRWATVLYSEADLRSPSELTIIKSSNFRLSLNGEAGTITFSTPKTRDTFQLATSASRPNPCPSYNVRVVDASPAHAVVRYVCPKKEYATGKFYASNEFLLYDIRTRSARSLWLAATFSKATAFPQADPIPKVRLVSDGYLFEWDGLFPSDGTRSKIRIKNKYIPKQTQGESALVCVDISNPKKPVTEGDMCEGEILKKIR